MRESIYLDTSVPSAYYDDREIEKRDVTRIFWEGLDKYDVYISPITIAELSNNEEPKRSKFKELIIGFKELTINPDVEKLAEGYIREGIIPVKYRGDAFHVAVASIYKVDYLVTWNCRHIAGVHKRKTIREFNVAAGIFAPEIAVPTEFIEEEV